MNFDIFCVRVSAKHYMNVVFIVLPLFQSNVVYACYTNENISSEITQSIIENTTRPEPDDNIVKILTGY